MRLNVLDGCGGGGSSKDRGGRAECKLMINLNNSRCTESRLCLVLLPIDLRAEIAEMRKQVEERSRYFSDLKFAMADFYRERSRYDKCLLLSEWQL